MAPLRVAMIFMALPGWMRMHSRLPAGQSWGGAGRALHSPHITSHIVTAQYCGIAAIHRVTRCRPGVYLDTQIVRVTISTEIQHPSSEKAWWSRGHTFAVQDRRGHLEPALGGGLVAVGGCGAHPARHRLYTGSQSTQSQARRGTVRPIFAMPGFAK